MSQPISRRQAMRQMVSTGLGAAGMLALPGLLSRVAFGAENARKPNILFILADDLSPTHVGYAKRFPFLKTPNIDRIANEGVRFDSFFCCTSLCSPSRATFMTGAYTHVHGVFENQETRDALVPMYPAILQKAGYETGHIGKWHQLRSADPRPGFDYWLSFRGQGNFVGQEMNLNGKLITFPGNTTEVRNGKTYTGAHVTEVLTEHAVKFIKQPRTKPFCLTLAHKAVHSPYTPTDKNKDALQGVSVPEPVSYNDSLESKPAWARRAAAASEAGRKATKEDIAGGPTPDKLPPRPWNGQLEWRLKQLRSVMDLDDSVGEVLKALEETGQLDNTLIIFAGDNGYFIGEHRRTEKRLAYEEAMRIPMCMRYPKLIKAGTVIDKMCVNVDIAPTVLELGGAAAPQSVQGKSLLPLLAGKDVPWRDAVLYEYYVDGNMPTPGMVGVRTEDWKYVTYPGLPGEIDELYDLKNDKYEMANLFAKPEYATKLQQMKALLEKTKKELNYTWTPTTMPAK